MKETILRKILGLLNSELSTSQKAFRSSSQDAAEAEGAMQSRYSTFKEEAQYLASGYARRMNEVNALIGNIEKLLANASQPCYEAGVGTLVKIENIETKEKETYFIVKLGGGMTLHDPESGQDTTVVSISTPMGCLLKRKKIGDSIHFPCGEKWIVVNVL